MNTNKFQGLFAWIWFVGVIILCVLACVVWFALLGIGESMRGWSDGSGYVPKRPVADMIVRICPPCVGMLIAAAFYPRLSRGAYSIFLSLAFTSYCIVLTTLLPKARYEAGMGLFIGIVVMLVCFWVLASLRNSGDNQPE
jgi:hypothetical protein